MRCAILDDYQNIALKIVDWTPLNGKVKVVTFNQHFGSTTDLVAALKDFEIIVIMRERTPFPATIFAELPNLKLLITSGMRNASVDLVAAAKHDVMVCGTQSFSEPPAELAWALILGLARHIVPENTALKNNGPWQSTLGIGLKDKQLGILGLGKIGSKVASVGLAFGMKVAAWSQNLTQEKANETGVELASSLENLLKTSDFITIHLVLSERTKNLIDAAELRFMKKTAFLINTSRAKIVNQTALIDALKSNQIAGAGIDVFEQEPLPPNDILRTLPNVLATPHLGYVTDQNYKIYFKEIIENITAFLEGQSLRKLT